MHNKNVQSGSFIFHISNIFSPHCIIVQQFCQFFGQRLSTSICWLKKAKGTLATPKKLITNAKHHVQLLTSIDQNLLQNDIMLKLIKYIVV